MRRFALLLACVALGAAEVPSFSPPTMQYDDLSSDSRFGASGSAKRLRDALTEVGIVQVLGVPGFEEMRTGALLAAHACDEGYAHEFADGTHRTTLASHTVPGPGGAAPFTVGDKCAGLERASGPLRDAVGEATRVFAGRLSSMLDVEQPLLSTRDGYGFGNFADVVDAGEHLEHLHKYTRPASSEVREAESHLPSSEGGKRAAEGGKRVAWSAEEEPTLPMHTDQGLFIAFTPAADVGSLRTSSARPNSDASSVLDPAEFVVELKDGSRSRAAFDPAALVFMIGEGSRQVLGPKMLSAGGFMPRPTPHALRVPKSTNGQRLWYGRMVLPPHDAKIGGESAVTYGEVRDQLMAAAATPKGEGSPEAGLPIGCHTATSPFDTPDLTTAAASSVLLGSHRQLLTVGTRTAWPEPPCANGTMMCWHRCMTLHGAFNPTHDATPEACAASSGLPLQCVNSKDERDPANGHGDYFPKCTASTANKTAPPALPSAPRAASCAAGFDAYASPSDYNYHIDLHGSCSAGWGQPSSPCEAKAGRLMWSIIDGKAHVKIAYNGLFGWIGFGIANPGGAHNGMNGGKVVMAIPGAPSTYDPATGLKITDTGPTINEYIINDDRRGSAFRLWNTPFSPPSLTAASYESTGCYSSMSFTTTAISGAALNLAGNDSMIWGANGADAAVGYHGATQRGTLNIKWSLGATTPAANRQSPANQTPTPVTIGTSVGALLLGVVLGALGNSKLRPKRPAGHVTLEGKAAAEGPGEKASPTLAKGTQEEQI